MKNARPANPYSHRAHRCAQTMTPTKSISPNPDAEKGKSQSILILNDDTDEQAILDALSQLPPEYVRKVRIYAQALTDIFYGR